MQINFNSPKEVTVVSEVRKTINSLTISHIIDDPINKKVVIRTLEAGQITIWQGAEYDAAGQWTDMDVINRINELYP